MERLSSKFSESTTVYYGPTTGDYKYYIKVFGATGTEVSSYALNITVTSWGDFEPNNNFADATSLEVYGTSTFAYGGQINPAGDVDYYSVNVPNYNRLGVTLGNLTANLNLELYNSSQALACGSYNAGTTNESVSIVCPVYNFGLASGSTVYIKVFGATGSEVSPYDLYLNLTQWIDMEPNNNLATATRIPSAGIYCGNISSPTDQDYLKIYMYRNSSFLVNITGLASNLDLGVYNSSGTLVGSSTNGGTASQQITLLIVAEGWYYVRIYPGAGAASPYQLNVSVWMQLDPNNNFASAGTLGQGFYYNTPINPAGDVDYYRIDVPASTELSVELTSIFGVLDLCLYSPSLALISNLTVNSGGSTATSDTPSTSCTYYFSVAGNDSTVTGSYDLTIYLINPTSVLQWGVGPGFAYPLKEGMYGTGYGAGTVQLLKFAVTGFSIDSAAQVECLMGTMYMTDSAKSQWIPYAYMSPAGAPMVLTSANTTWQELGGGYTGYPCYWTAPEMGYMGGFGVIEPLMSGAVNMSWYCQSFTDMVNVSGSFPPNMAFSSIGNTFIVTNTTSQQVFLRLNYTANGVLSDLMEVYTPSPSNYVEMSPLQGPAISLIDPAQGQSVPSGGNVAFSVAGDGGEVISSVQYYWSNSTAEPDWKSVGTVLSSPYNLTMPSGSNGTIYLHVFAQSALGPTSSTYFTINRATAPGTSTPPPPNLLMIILIVVGAGGVVVVVWIGVKVSSVRKGKKSASVKDLDFNW
ncbi:MAG TPA: PPC domain-containing protein [Candidatus Lokiarchaeia archaeon]|nr:PPC domain-containing protein [Candidatus Lokiarchaeia archaeon]